jgi:adenosylhomocysteine nucleosidase
MPEEMNSLLENLQIKQTLIKGKRTYYQGLLFETEVVLVFSRWGKVAAAATVTQLLNSFEISEVLFSGVAGGLNPKLTIGDIVIGTELIQYDMDASPLYPTLEIPLLDKTSFETFNTTRLKRATKLFLNDYSELFTNKVQKEYGIDNPKLYQGLIVSGDHFVNSSEKIKNILSKVPKALCVEMEGAAVAQVCYEYDIPFQIIRIISDKANDNSHIDFPKFANEVAGKYALGILEKYFS